MLAGGNFTVAQHAMLPDDILDLVEPVLQLSVFPTHFTFPPRFHLANLLPKSDGLGI